MSDKTKCPECGSDKAFEGARLCPACTVVDFFEHRIDTIEYLGTYPPAPPEDD